MAAWAQPSALFEDGGGRRELLPLFFYLIRVITVAIKVPVLISLTSKVAV